MLKKKSKLENKTPCPCQELHKKKSCTKHFTRTEERHTSQTDRTRGDRPVRAALEGCREETAHDLLMPPSHTSFSTLTSNARYKRPHGNASNRPSIHPQPEYHATGRENMTVDTLTKRIRHRHRIHANGKSHLTQHDTGFSLPVPCAQGPGVKTEA